MFIKSKLWYMAENNLYTKKDHGSPIGIILGITVFVIGVALQDETFTISGFITNITLFLELNSFKWLRVENKLA